MLRDGFVLTLVLALVGAMFSAVAWVLQYHEAHEAPRRLFLSPRLLIELARHPLWLAGLAAMVMGGLVQAAALARGSLAVVEPALTTSLLFALWLSAMWRRERLTRGEWGAALLVCAGLTLLLTVGSPTIGSSTMSLGRWVAVTVAAWGGASALVVVSRGRPPGGQAAMVAGGASVLFGLQDALTRFCLDAWHAHGVMSLVTTWQPYVLVVSAVYGLTLMQSSYEVGPLTASLPSLAIGEPVVGMLIGVLAFDEHLRTTGLAPLWEALGAAVMIAGTTLLARSPLVLGKAHPGYAERCSLTASRQVPAAPTLACRDA